jgi:7,8-dihydropterin-6-yl-methyl-4-(beta-D-ribofuranosyl)aminobenzene 5'-phosphate synthase
MIELATSDRIEVLVLVDNVTDFLSSSPAGVESELSRFWRRGARLQAGHLLCCAAHGFACAVTAWSGGKSRTLLFDAGPDGAVLRSNVARLGFAMGTVDAVFLSHGHWDHAGGMIDALDMIRDGNGHQAVATLMHPGMYRSRGQHRRTEDGSAWEPDPLLMDERFVAVRLKGKGVLVFTACSHAGVINVLTHARVSLPDDRLHGVIGGFHLAGGTERIIPETVAAMRDFGLSIIAPAHCTGWRALGAVVATFGEAVVPSAVGKTYCL